MMEIADQFLRCRMLFHMRKKMKMTSIFSSPLLMKPIYAMYQWKHPQTRYGRLALLIVLPAGIIDREDSAKAELSTAKSLELSF